MRIRVYRNGLDGRPRRIGPWHRWLDDLGRREIFVGRPRHDPAPPRTA